ncbi:MAG: alpha/beta fold hydrolase [Alphaproteobacteria bacterium]
MATFVIVHGAWQGGWIWSRVARWLRDRGHSVFTPTCTGLGDRSHLLTRAVNLTTHVEDILALFKWESLDDVVLAGHSYGGVVITHVADRIPERIRALVYLDAFITEHGQSLMDLALPERRRQLREGATRFGDGWRVPGVSAAGYGISDPADQAWIDALQVMQPLACLEQQAELSGAWQRVAGKNYVLATRYDPSPFRQFHARLRDDPVWRTFTIPTHHNMMVEMPARTAEILETCAQ